MENSGRNIRFYFVHNSFDFFFDGIAAIQSICLTSIGIGAIKLRRLSTIKNLNGSQFRLKSVLCG